MMLIYYHLTHNLKVVGSNPTPATKINPAIAGFFVEHKYIKLRFVFHCRGLVKL